MAAWYKNRINVIGVEPEGAPTMTKAFEAGAPVDAEASGIAADSLAPRRIGEQVFPIASRYVSSVYLVSDDDIRAAQRTLWDSLRIVAEPGGAAAFACLLSGKYKPLAGEQVGVVISGGNTVAVNFDLQ
jgi:threonine dehydratase